MNTYITVHAIAQNNEGKYLILQRAVHRSNPNTWNWITGYIRDRESAEEAALRELREETNLTGEIAKTTVPYWVDSENTRWLVIASLIIVNNTDTLSIDKSESQNYQWINSKSKLVEEFEPIKVGLEKLNLL